MYRAVLARAPVFLAHGRAEGVTRWCSTVHKKIERKRKTAASKMRFWPPGGMAHPITAHWSTRLFSPRHSHFCFLQRLWCRKYFLVRVALGRGRHRFLVCFDFPLVRARARRWLGVSCCTEETPTNAKTLNRMALL